MIAQSSANFPIFCGHLRQRGRGFGALAETLGRTAISFIKKYVVRTELLQVHLWRFLRTSQFWGKLFPLTHKKCFPVLL